MKKVNPRHGTLQFWPRKRSTREIPRLRTLSVVEPNKLSGFPAYKVGMTHILVTDTHKHSTTKGEVISLPVTILEAPPLKVAGMRLYKQTEKGINVVKEIILSADKHLKSRLNIKSSNEKSLEDIKPEEYEYISVLIFTQPHLAGFSKKRPDLFELHVGGSPADQFNFIKQNLSKEIPINMVFSEGQFLDSHSISKGKGFQGSVKRFGISLKHHKTEKGRRNPGSLGGWKGQGHVMWRVAHAGQTGYFQRTEYNKMLLKISQKPEEINPKGGFNKYGLVKTDFILIKGSIPGPKKRLIVFTNAQRQKKDLPLPTIETVLT